MIKGVPVTIAENGFGFPVRPVERDAPLLTVAENGRGAPITLSPNGAPFVLSGLNPPDFEPGPLDVVVWDDSGFTNFSREFELASDCCVLGLACAYTGDPDIVIKHGADTLTIVQQARGVKHLALLAVGRGLTIEAADVTITATGGTLRGGTMRINEMRNIAPGLVGWTGSGSGSRNPIPNAVMSGTSGGVVKGVYCNGAFDTGHSTRVIGADNVWTGLITTGVLSTADFSTSGPWTIGPGWSVDGDKFVHSGERSVLSMDYTGTIPEGSSSQRIFAVMPTRRDSVDIRTRPYGETGSSIGGVGPGERWVISGYTTAVPEMYIYAIGDVTISDISVVGDMDDVAWSCFSAPAVDGAELSFYLPFNPEWVWVAAEVLGEDY